MNNKKPHVALMWACIAALVASCGGGDGDSVGTPPPPAPAPPTGSPPPSGPDAAVPTATLVAPVALATGLGGTIALTATATDDVAVAGVEFQVDGITVGTEDTTAPYAASISAANYATGQHIVRVRARDTSNKLSAWSSHTVRFDTAGSVTQGFTRNEAWVTGLTDSTAIAQAPDGRLFVAQQGGTVRIVKDGALLAAPFLDVTATTDNDGERGVIGVALHPNFATNGYVYIHYTSTAGGAAHGRVSRFIANGDVSTGTETVLFDLPNLNPAATNHNGGALHFGLDGKLYVGVGDNANRDKAPLLTDVFGKLLRFNDDGSIPTDNPHYATQTGLARAIWARGLRNPFTFAVQPVTGKIHINDVGESSWEEINVGESGANYGWPAAEGPTTATGVTAPLFAYSHSDANPVGSGAGGFFKGFSIAGGAFYPATGSFPAAYRNNYFFADYVSRYVGRLDPANNNAASVFATLNFVPVDLLVGADGALYVLNRTRIIRIAAS